MFARLDAVILITITILSIISMILSFTIEKPNLKMQAIRLKKVDNVIMISESNKESISINSKGMLPIISLSITSVLWGSYGIGMKILYSSASPPELLFNLVAAAVSSISLITSLFFMKRIDKNTEIQSQSQSQSQSIEVSK